MRWSQSSAAGLVLLATAAFAAPSPEPWSQRNGAWHNPSHNVPASSKEETFQTGPTQRFGGQAANSYHSPAWLPYGQNLGNSQPQWKTNGRSQLGTFNAPKLPDYMPDGRSGGHSGGYPWGGRRANNSNPYTDMPDTGITRYYDFTLQNTTLAPDGVERPGILVNGQFPAPTIEANWGDWVQVKVTNNLDEGTSLHWHGLLQKETPWFDGVPSVSQCPIAPGASFTYRFRADLYGTSWYHSHYSAQYADGAFGALIIYGPHDNAQYDEDLGPVIINDWFHQEYHALIDQVMAPASEKLLPPMSQNVLINGKMSYPCANATAGQKCTPNAGVSKFKFQSGKSYRLRLINSGAEALQKFSIDNHKLTVIAHDFVPVVPYDTNVVTLGVGQRTDVVVQATGKPTDAVWMRSELGPSAFVGGCSLPDGVSPTGVAAIYYENADDNSVPTTESGTTQAQLLQCQDDDISKAVPFFPITPDPNPETVQQMDITYNSNGTHNLFFVDQSSFRANFNDPVLLDAKAGQTTFTGQYNVYNFGASKSIRLVVYNHALTGSHPMHMHGHNVHVLAVGSGTWDGHITNPSNTARRDVSILPVAVSPTVPSYIVLQIEADNPGVWPFHCHIAWHISAGLYTNLLERPQDIQRDMAIPGFMAQTCRDWSAWTSRNVVEAIDSGL